MKNILIYGTSGKAINELPALLKLYRVIGFVDSNPNFEPKTLLDLPVYHFTAISALEFDLVIICSSFYGEISQNLLSVGVENFIDSSTLPVVQKLTSEWVVLHKKSQNLQRKSVLKGIPNVALETAHIEGAEMITNRIELLQRLPKNAVVAEFGVANGDYSSEILRVSQPKHLHLIDVWDSERYNEGLMQNIKTKFADNIQAKQITIHRQFSHDAIVQFPDEYFDWVYIDTTHSYQQTRLELELVASKIKPGGVIAGHDYLMGNWADNNKYGVVEAVHQFCVLHHYKFKYLTMDLTENQSFAIEKIN